MRYIIIGLVAGDLAKVKGVKTESEAVVEALKLCEEYKIDLTDVLENYEAITPEALDADAFDIGYGNQESTVWIKEVDF